MSRVTGRLAAALRARLAFESRGNVVFACLAAIVGCGLWALWRGQDTNWDLRNYHFYNGWAALHDRLGVDLAPAQMQSYFNPALDILQYALLTGLPAPLAGFLLGAWHGVLFVLVAAIAWRVLADDPRRAIRVPLLALAGLLTAAFLSELGNTMGDNTTAVPVLGALVLVLSAQARARAGQGAIVRWLLAGVLIGLAVSFKLTNAVFAVALGLAALVDGGRLRARLAGATWMTLAALACFALVAGPWFVQVWREFGNPLFPQFNAWFQAPLAQPVSVADTRWLPKRWIEWLSWPLVFSRHPLRVSEVALTQFGWAVLYLLALGGLGWRLLRRAPADARPMLPAARALLAYFLVGYALWQAIFSIHRYLVAVEVLLPLLLWWAWARLLPAVTLKWRAPLLALLAVISVHGAGEWGHALWRSEAVAVSAPPMARPADSVVVLVGDHPQAWRVPALPAEAVYVSVASNLPATPAYLAKVREILAGRSAHYAMLPAIVDRSAARVERLNTWARRLGWDAQPGCRMLRWVSRKGRRALLDDSTPGRCVLVSNKGMDVAAVDAQARDVAAAQLATIGWRLAPEGCQRLPARLGGEDFPYQWCVLQPAD